MKTSAFFIISLTNARPRLTGRSREIVAEELDGTAEAIYLVDLAAADRAHALGRAGAVLSHDTSKELRPDEILAIRNARLLQFTAAGVDWVPTRDLPRELPVAANKGGGAEPMAEHVVALALAAAKRLFIEHASLERGEFNQRSANRMLRGGVCGILGFGNVGVATARLMRAFGMKIHAINRRGASDEPTDWIATADLLDEMLRVADVLVISAALTTATQGLIACSPGRPRRSPSVHPTSAVSQRRAATGQTGPASRSTSASTPSKL